MKKFTMTELTCETEDGRFELTRMRTSKGHASITVRQIGGGKLTFSNEPPAEDGAGLGFGDDYEGAALDVCKALNEIALTDCSVPQETDK